MSSAPTRTEAPRTGSIPQLLAVREVARLLALSRAKVYEMVASGELPAYRPGGRIRVASQAVAELLDRTKL